MSRNSKTIAGLPAGLSLLLGLLIGAIVLLIAIIILRQASAPADQNTLSFVREDSDFNGIDIIEPARDMPDFTLISHLNEPIQRSSLDGRHSLIFFGFTHCPDVCPLTLNEFRSIRELLGDDAEAINFVFVTVDGERDTAQVLQRNFELRDVADFMIGMTGTEDEVRQMGVDYGLRFVYGQADSQGRYSVDHTASSFLLDPEGRWVRRYAFGTDPDLIAEDLKALISAADAS